MPQLKVLHLVDELEARASHLEGVTRVLSWWLPAHDAERFRVMAATLGTRDLAGEYLENLGIRVAYLGRSGSGPRLLVELAGLLRREAIDVLHLHGYRAANLGRLAARLLRIPCVLHGHALDANIGPLQRAADRLLSSATTRAIAISTRVRDFLARERAVPPSRIDVIPGGIPLGPLTGLSGRFGTGRRASWRRLHRIAEDCRVVTVVGRLEVGGGHALVLEAARTLLQSFRNVAFVIVGDGPLQAQLRRCARDLGIARHVAFLGARDDVPRILAGSDIAVFPATREGGPLALFEAMANGCGVVISEACGLASAVRDGESGFVVPPENSRAIVSKLKRLLDDVELLQRMAARGRTAVAHYDVTRSVRRFEDLYAGLALLTAAAS